VIESQERTNENNTDVDRRVGFAQAKFASSIQAATSSALFRSTTRIESSDAVIRVYDGAGNVIETHEHAGNLESRSGPLRIALESFLMAGWHRMLVKQPCV